MSLYKDFKEEDLSVEFNEIDEEEILLNYLQDTLFWITKGKNKINILDMTTEHIQNCLKIPLYPNKEIWDIVFKFELNKIRKIKC